MSRLTQILRGKKIKPLTEMESAVKYAIDNSGGGGGVFTVPAAASMSDDKLVLTLAYTADVLYQQVESGCMAKVSFDVESAAHDNICSISCLRRASGENTYSYWYSAMTGQGKVLATEMLSGSDYVVLTEQ